MKRILTCLSAGSFLILIGACGSEESTGNNNIKSEQNQNSQNSDAEKTNEENEKYTNTLEIVELSSQDEKLVVLEDLVEEINGELDYDTVNRTARASVGEREFYMVEDIPVVEVNGQYLPYDDIQLFFDEETPYVTLAFLDKALEGDYQLEESNVNFRIEDEEWEEIGNDVSIHDKSPSEMVDFLSFLERPIEGASVSTVESHLPGAPRDYRNGKHEGIDYYDYASGVEITTDTPIYAMAEGTVVRVDHDFEEYDSHEERNAELEKAAEVGFTPEYILDRLRGMQVWVQYQDGVMIRFAHLDSIPDELELGEKVDEETVIGYVGNTGTSDSLNGGDGGLHLHKDLLINGELFWEPYDLEETAAILYDLWP
jgi:murein DD-endopeptidase MepM/ murein hydrolase activator NlpD